MTMANLANSAGCIEGRLPNWIHLFEKFISSPTTSTKTRRMIIIPKNGKENLRSFL